MKREYYSDGRISQKKAEALGPEIEAVAKANGGRATAWDMLEFARHNPSSAFHKEITWDRDAAAEQWQLQECRTVLEQVKVRIVNVEGRVVQSGPVVICIDAEPKVRVEVGKREHNLRPYVLTEIVRTEPDLQDAALREAKSLVLAFRRRVTTLEELFGGRPTFTQLKESLDLFAQDLERDEVGQPVAA